MHDTSELLKQYGFTRCQSTQGNIRKAENTLLGRWQNQSSLLGAEMIWQPNQQKAARPGCAEHRTAALTEPGPWPRASERQNRGTHRAWAGPRASAEPNRGTHRGWAGPRAGPRAVPSPWASAGPPGSWLLGAGSCGSVAGPELCEDLAML